MQLLFLGNSFTYFNDMPAMVARELSCGATMVVRGGAFLHDFLNMEDELCLPAMTALRGRVTPRDERVIIKSYGEAPTGHWDYVVLQEQSFNAVGNTEDYLKSVAALCGRVRDVGAIPVIYATWPYRDGSDKLGATWLSYDEMRHRMSAACERASSSTGALIARVGEAFVQAEFDVYAPDDYHPSEAGSRLAAQVIADAIRCGA